MKIKRIVVTVLVVILACMFSVGVYACVTHSASKTIMKGGIAPFGSGGSNDGGLTLTGDLLTGLFPVSTSMDGGIGSSYRLTTAADTTGLGFCLELSSSEDIPESVANALRFAITTSKNGKDEPVSTAEFISTVSAWDLDPEQITLRQSQLFPLGDCALGVNETMEIGLTVWFDADALSQAEPFDSELALSLVVTDGNQMGVTTE